MPSPFIDALLGGPMMRHLSVHLASVDDLQFEHVKTMLLPLGETLIRRLVEALLADGQCHVGPPRSC